MDGLIMSLELHERRFQIWISCHVGPSHSQIRERKIMWNEKAKENGETGFKNRHKVEH